MKILIVQILSELIDDEIKETLDRIPDAVTDIIHANHHDAMTVIQSETADKKLFDEMIKKLPKSAVIVFNNENCSYRHQGDTDDIINFEITEDKNIMEKSDKELTAMLDGKYIMADTFALIGPTIPEIMAWHYADDTEIINYYKPCPTAEL